MPNTLGKIIPLNHGDEDKDKVIDCWDGYTLGTHTHKANDSSGWFVPIVIEIPGWLDLDKITIAFQYACAHTAPPTDKTKPPQTGDGCIRIWRKNGKTGRNGWDAVGANAGVYGDFYISGQQTPGTRFDFAKKENGNWEVELYVEGVVASQSIGKMIEATLSYTPTEGVLQTASDKVRYVCGNKFVYGLVEYGYVTHDGFEFRSPVRRAKIEMTEIIPWGVDKKVYSYTHDDGYYIIHYGNLGKCSELKVYAQTKPEGTDPDSNTKRAIKVQQIGFTSSAVYFDKMYDDASSVGSGIINQNNRANRLDHFINAETLSPRTFEIESKVAFWVFDALVMASLYHATLPGIPEGTTVASFHNEGTITTNEHIKIQYNTQEMKYSWRELDILLHEYGHIAASESGMIGSLSLTHSTAHEESANCRDYHNRIVSMFSHDNCRSCAILAFDEGWASYYAVAAKERFGVPAVFASYLFKEKEYKCLGIFDVEKTTPNSYLGEDQEMAIMRLLWDLHDPIDVTEDDSFSLGKDSLFCTIRDNNIHAVSDLWSFLTQGLSLHSLEFENYGKLFSSHGIGITKNDLTSSLTESLAVFSWKNPKTSSRPGALPSSNISLFDESKIVFYTNDGAVVHTSTTIAVDSNDRYEYELSAFTLRRLAQVKEKIYWHVLIRQSTMSKDAWYRSSFTGQIRPFGVAE